jgi:hypothetical protein
MRSWIELSRNQTMGTSLPEKSLSIDLIRPIADHASSIQPIRRRSVAGGSQDSWISNHRRSRDYIETTEGMFVKPFRFCAHGY